MFLSVFNIKNCIKICNFHVYLWTKKVFGTAIQRGFSSKFPVDSAKTYSRNKYNNCFNTSKGFVQKLKQKIYMENRIN